VGGVRVTLRPLAEGALAADLAGGVSDADGRFQLDGVAAGTYLLEADAAEHVLETTMPVRVEPARVASVEVRLEAAAKVRGVVVAGERPVAGARVTFDAQGRLFRATAEPDGSFVAHLRRGGLFTVAVLGHEVLAPASPIAVPAATDRLRIEVAPLGSIAGRVRAADGVAVPYATVIRQPRGGTVRADAEGWFAFEAVPDGRWELSASSGEPAARSSKPLPIELRGRGRIEGVELRLDAAASIAGIVVDERGAPLENAEVSIQRAESGLADLGMAVTTADGRFEVAPLLGGGDYRVEVRPYRNAWATLPPAGDAFPPLHLETATTRLGEVRLVVRARTSEIAGVVRDAAGRPVPDVAVRVAHVPGGRPALGRATPFPSARTGVDGRFRVRVAEDGPFVVEARLGDGPAGVVTGVAAGATGVTVRLPATAAIEGAVAGMRSGFVVAHRQGEPYDRELGVAAIVAGRFRLDALAAGRYRISANDAEGNSATAEVSVAEGAVARAELVARATGTLRVRVVLAENRRPVAGVHCVAFPRVGSSGGPGVNPYTRPWAGATDDLGWVVFNRIAAGGVFVACQGEVHGSNVADVPEGGEVSVEVPSYPR
jgi:hypothetical protein